MFTVSISKRIQCPIDNAFAFVSDFENDAKWWPGVVEAKRLTEVRTKGAQYWQRNRVLGLVYSLTLYIDDYIENTRISFHSDGSAIIFSGEYLFVIEEDGIILTMNAKVEANHVLFKVLNTLFKTVIERMTEKNFNSLKNVLETSFPSNTYSEVQS